MKHCLVVDDSSVIRKVARRIMEAHGVRVSEAADGTQAIELCRQAMPDFVFVDYSMPEMDGFEFVRLMRSTPGGDQPKVIFCTVDNDVAQIARAIRAGADEHMMKPFDKDILEGKLHAVGMI
jgi:two-component system chemotaxis response regulator CheY